MPLKVADLYMQVNAETSGLNKGEAQVRKFGRTTKQEASKAGAAMKAFGAQANRAIQQATNSLGAFGGIINAMPPKIAVMIAAMTAGYFAFKGMSRAISAMVTSFNRFESSLKTTEQLLKTTGNAAGVTAAQIEQMAIDIDNATLGSAQEAREAANMLLTFQTITGDTFERTLKAAQDLSAVGFGDLRASVTRLAKAVADPARRLGELGEAGVTFTKSEEKVIKSLQASGDLLGAQAKLLEAVESQSKGAAAAQSDTFAGALDDAAMALTMFGEQAGVLLLKLLPIELAIDAVAVSFNFLAKSLRAINNNETIGDLETELTKAEAQYAKLNAQLAEHNKLVEAGAKFAHAGEQKSALEAALEAAELKITELKSHLEDLTTVDFVMAKFNLPDDLRKAVEDTDKELKEFDKSLLTTVEGIKANGDELKKAFTDAFKAESTHISVLPSELELLTSQYQQNLDRVDAMVSAQLEEQHTKTASQMLKAYGEERDIAMDAHARKLEELKQALRDEAITLEQFYSYRDALAKQHQEALDKLTEPSAESQRAANDLQALEQRYETETQALERARDDQLAIITAAEEARLATETSYAALRLKVHEEYQEGLKALEADSTAYSLLQLTGLFEERKKFSERSQEDNEELFASQVDSLRTLTEEAGQQSERMFKISKAIALATATVKGYEAATSSYAAGAAIGGPPVGAAFAAVSLAATTLQLAKLKATEFEGKQGGGLVAPGRMYEVNETGQPELLSVGNRQFLMTGGQGGNVTNAADSRNAFSPKVSIHNHAGVNVEAIPTNNGQDLEVMITAVKGAIVHDIVRGGDLMSPALEGTYGLTRAG